jgi:hypothetical protein
MKIAVAKDQLMGIPDTARVSMSGSFVTVL